MTIPNKTAKVIQGHPVFFIPIEIHEKSHELPTKNNEIPIMYIDMYIYIYHSLIIHIYNYIYNYIYILIIYMNIYIIIHIIYIYISWISHYPHEYPVRSHPRDGRAWRSATRRRYLWRPWQHRNAYAIMDQPWRNQRVSWWFSLGKPMFMALK